MALQIFLLLLGLAFIVYGADWLVDGASSLARKAGISEFVIGLTIVGFGTSCPELVVSLTGALEGNSDIAVGNVVGSNIFNTLLILGITALLIPISITKTNRNLDIPLVLLASLLLCISGLVWKGIGLLEGVGMLVLFGTYLFYCFKKGKSSEDAQEDDTESERQGWKLRILSSVWGQVLFIVLGLAGLIFGGKVFVESAVNIARIAGVSDKFIAITVLAAGTSLPELVTSIVAAFKGKGQMALGNILGSNMFNILLILGLSAIVHPLSMERIDMFDMGALALSALLLLAFAFLGRKDRINRTEGALLLLCFIVYYVHLFQTV